jgi:DNA-binding NarL/FixJ family response regulator
MVDDHPVVLAGLKALVGSDRNFEIVGEACDGRTALSLAEHLRPDMIILDLSLPELSGVQVARRLLAAQPGCRVLILSVHEDRAYMRQLVEIGVSGYLLKRSAADELIRAMHAIVAGGVYLDPSVASKVVGQRIRRPTHSEVGQSVALSDREADVLRLIAGGHSNKGISALLKISVKTVETYKARAMEKLGFSSRIDIVNYAADQGWLADR